MAFFKKPGFFLNPEIMEENELHPSVELTLCVKMYFMGGQQFMEGVSESFIIDVGEDIVHTTVLKQVVLYAYKSKHMQQI